MGFLFDSLAIELFIIVASLIYLFVQWGKKKYRYFEERGVPYLKPTFLIGSGLQNLLAREHMSETHLRIYKQLKGHKVAGAFQVFAPFYTIRDPAIAEQVLVRDFSHFHDRGVPVDEKVNPLEGHLFFLEGEKWRTLRNKLSPTFTSGKLKWMFHQMSTCSDLLVKMLQKEAAQGDVEIKDILARFTTDVIGSCAFGYEPVSMDDPNCKFREMGKKIFQPPLHLVLLGALRFFFPSIFFRFRIKTVPQDVNDFFFSIVNQGFEHRIKTGEKRNDFLQLLLQLKQKGTIEIDPREQLEEDEEHIVHNTEHDSSKDNIIELNDAILTAQAFVFFVAGFETSATAMSFTLYLLAKNPETQEKARLEIREVKKKYNGAITYEAIKEMTHLSNCLSEAMRLYPPISVIFRQCTKDIVLEDGSPIEKGSTVMIPVIGMHYDPELFPDPEKYNPDRFLIPPKPGSFTPFGGGPRLCIGKRFAEVEAKLGLARILDNFVVSLSPKLKEPIQLNPRSFVTQAMEGIWLKIEKANGSQFD